MIDFKHLIFKDKLVEEDAWEVVHRSPCLADTNRFKIIATVNRSLRDILPIIYLSQPNSKYIKKPESVGYTFLRHNILVGHDGSVAITYIKDDEEMDALRAKVIQIINSSIVYSLTHHEPLDDLIERKKALSPLALYEYFKALPELNCGGCGEKNCFGFVARLYNGERDASDCPHVEASRIARELYPVKF